MKRSLALYLISALFSSVSMASQLPLIGPLLGVAKVTGFAQAHGDYGQLQGVDVIVLETGEKKATTDEKGEFSFDYRVGDQVTLMFKHPNYHPSQSATITVQPSNGKDGKNYFTYQAISYAKTELLTWTRLLPYPYPLLKSNHCQMIVTVAGKGKTLYDNEQGEAGAELLINYSSAKKHTSRFPGGDGTFHLCYYGTLPIFHTNPTCLYEKTTADGGVFVANIPQNKDQLYIVKASKPQASFSSAIVQCREDWWNKHAPGHYMLLNLSPPTGPVAQ